MKQLGTGFQTLINQDTQRGAGQPPSPSPSPGPRARIPQTQAPYKRLPSLIRLPGGSQFLYSPTLLEVLPKEVALSVLVRSLRDPSPEIRVLSLQGLGNILFHPEKVSGCGSGDRRPGERLGAQGFCVVAVRNLPCWSSRWSDLHPSTQVVLREGLCC